MNSFNPRSVVRSRLKTQNSHRELVESKTKVEVLSLIKFTTNTPPLRELTTECDSITYSDSAETDKQLSNTHIHACKHTRIRVLSDFNFNGRTSLLWNLNVKLVNVTLKILY